MPTGHYRFRRSLGNVSSNFRGARPDTYPLLSYVLQNRALDLSNVGSLTISDISGNGNNATLYTGIYVSTNGTTDKAIVADASAAGSGNYYLTGKIKPNGTTQAKATIDGSALNLSGLTADVWQDFTTTTKTSVTPDTVAVGWNGGGNYSAAEWSDVRLINASDNSVVAHWKLYDSAAASLGGYPAIDCVGGYHGAHVGCSSGSGEGVDTEVAGISATLDDKMWFDGVNDYVNCGADYTTNTFFGACVIEFTTYIANTGVTQALCAIGSSAYRIYTNSGNWKVNGGTQVIGQAVESGIHTIAVTFNASGQATAFSYDGSVVWTGTEAAGSLVSGTTFRIGANFNGLIVNKTSGLIYDFSITGSAVRNLAYTGTELITWTDTSGGGNNGTVNGSPVTVGQKRETILQTAGEDFNKLMWFDGVNDYVNLNHSFIPATDDFDIEIDFLNAGSPSVNKAIISQDSGSSDLYMVGVRSTTGRIMLYLGGNSIIETTGETTGEKQTIRLRRIGNGFTLHLDGVLIYSGTHAITFPTVNTWIGNWTSVPTRFITGIIWNIRKGGQVYYLGNGNTNAAWVDQIGSNDGTVNGSPSLYHVAESETTAGQDALGTAIENPRPNERVLNLTTGTGYAEIADSASLDLTTEATWEVWGDFSDATTEQYVLHSFDFAGAKRSWGLMFGTTYGASRVGIIRFGSATGASQYSGSFDIGTGIKQILATYNAGTVVIYINGLATTLNNQVGIVPASLFVTDTGIRVGATFGNTFNEYSQIGDIRIYDRALTADEVLKNYNARKSAYGL